MKFELFKPSSDLVNLICRYKNDFDRPDSEYFSGKKQAESLAGIASALSNGIRTNSTDKKRLVELSKHFANLIIEECDSDKYVDEDKLPLKDEVLCEDARLIDEQIRKEMIGKIICYHRGKIDNYIKVATAELAETSYCKFEFAFTGCTFSVLPDDTKSYSDRGYNIGFALDNYVRLDETLLLDGQNSHTKESLFIVTESQLSKIIAKQAQRIANGFDILIGSVFGK